MIFHSLRLTDEGEVSAIAEGHATQVLQTFHTICSLLLVDRGPWRISNVHGEMKNEAHLDSEMWWELVAKTKNKE